jgi:membrane fusion protein, peptide pheromone/bacteriocin exporter
MSKQIFPASIAENSQESNFSRHNVRMRVMNWIIVAMAIVCISALPFIETEVGIRGHGMIRPVTELVKVTSPVSGILKEYRVSENIFVSKAETIAVIDAPHLEEQFRYVNHLRYELKRFLEDLQTLLSTDLNRPPDQPAIQSEKYMHSYLQFRHNWMQLNREVSHQRKELDRQYLLRKRELTSTVQYEEAEYQYHMARSNLNLMVEQQINQWQSDLRSKTLELEDYQFQIQQVQEELSLYTIRSPVTGTIQNLAPVLQNSFVHPNQVLGEITPDTSLIAAVFVSPKDIGLLRTGMPVRLNIDAYNQNEWGTLEGTVIDISGDVLLSDQQPVYRVLCSLARPYMKLSNGIQGELKKGMSLQARFIITRRTLLQLLFDNVDDWLNPFWDNNHDTETIAGG